MKQTTYFSWLAKHSFFCDAVDHSNINPGNVRLPTFSSIFIFFSQIENIRLPLWEIGCILAFLRRLFLFLKYLFSVLHSTLFAFLLYFWNTYFFSLTRKHSQSSITLIFTAKLQNRCPFQHHSYIVEKKWTKSQHKQGITVFLFLYSYQGQINNKFSSKSTANFIKKCVVSLVTAII